MAGPLESTWLGDASGHACGGRDNHEATRPHRDGQQHPKRQQRARLSGTWRTVGSQVVQSCYALPAGSHRHTAASHIDMARIGADRLRSARCLKHGNDLTRRRAAPEAHNIQGGIPHHATRDTLDRGIRACTTGSQDHMHMQKQVNRQSVPRRAQMCAAGMSRATVAVPCRTSLRVLNFTLCECDSLPRS